jgi:hypothetical protein
MDATLNAAHLSVDRTGLVPDVFATLTPAWGRKVSEQTVRASGLHGSAIIPFVGLKRPDIWGCSYVYSTTVILPYGYFGSTVPPMIYVMPQYGSMVIYKHIMDVQQKIVEPYTMGNSAAIGDRERFTTTVEKLNWAGGIWTFSIVHAVSDWVLAGVNSGANIKKPYGDMRYGWWPNIAAATDPARMNGIVLHWVAFGGDPNA